jgi:acetyltransferase
MNFFFNPKSIAVLGATPNPFKGGCSILKNLLAGYEGKIYPINPRYEEIEGLRCFASAGAVEGPIDLAIVFVPAAATPPAVEDCVRKGIPGIIVESGGFAETGAGGRRLQQGILDVTRPAGVRVWGPNCMGLVDAVRGYAFSFLDPKALQSGLVSGNVSLVVQSGMLSAGFLVDIMTHGIMGISKVCSVGNKMDVDECDLLPFLLADPHTAVIGLYLETIADGRRFLDLCRGASKPIVVLKGGKSSKGARAAMSHTASLAGNRRIISGALAQAGVIEAHDFKQMMDLCRSLAMATATAGRPQGGVAVLTFSGGAGIVSSDFLEEAGLPVVDFANDTMEALQAIFPDWMPVANPVDLWPAMEKNAATDMDIYSKALKAVLADPAVDAVLMHVFVGNFRIRINLHDVAMQSRAAGKPVFIWLLGRRDDTYPFQIAAREYGVPVFQELYRAVECLQQVMNRKELAPSVTSNEAMTPSPLSPDLTSLLEKETGPLDEFISKQILKAYGIPTVEESVVAGLTECGTALNRIGFPAVMKGLQDGAVHKTEMGLVHLDIHNRKTLAGTFRALMRKMNGKGRVLLQKQLKGRIELIVGLMRDPQFGPCVMIGLGGIMAEIFENAVFAVAPLSHAEALEMVGRLQGQRLLDGFRGAPSVDRHEIARILSALGNVGIAHPRIQEIDINPLIITSGGAVAVDATIVLN